MTSPLCFGWPQAPPLHHLLAARRCPAHATREGPRRRQGWHQHLHRPVRAGPRRTERQRDQGQGSPREPGTRSRGAKGLNGSGSTHEPFREPWVERCRPLVPRVGLPKTVIRDFSALVPGFTGPAPGYQLHPTSYAALWSSVLPLMSRVCELGYRNRVIHLL